MDPSVHRLGPDGAGRLSAGARIRGRLALATSLLLPPAAQARDAAGDIEAAVESHIKERRRQGDIAPDERTAWSVYDFTTGEKLVDINEEIPLQGASLVKPFFCLAFFHRVREGRLIYGAKSRRHMERAIRDSSNGSANWIIRQVGGPAVLDRILRERYGRIFQDTRIVEYIPPDGRAYRNKASVHDYSRFLYALWHGDIPGAEELKRLMSLPNRDRLYVGAAEVPKGTRVYDKTGSTARLCGDMGILIVRGKDGREHPYTLIGVIEKRRRARDFSSWIRSRGDVIRSISNLVYRAIVSRHRAGAASNAE